MPRCRIQSIKRKNRNFYIQNFKLVDSMSFTFVSLCIIFDVFLAFNLKK